MSNQVFLSHVSMFMLDLAGNIVLELSKDKHNASFLDRQLIQFQNSVSRVENELSAQIRYLTQVKSTAADLFQKRFHLH